MLLKLQAGKSIQFNDLLLKVNESGNLEIEIDLARIASGAMGNLTAAVNQALMPLIQQGAKLLDFPVDDLVPADVSVHAASVVGSTIVAGIRAQQASAAKQAQDAAAAAKKRADDLAADLLPSTAAPAASNDSKVTPVAAVAGATEGAATNVEVDPGQIGSGLSG